MYQQTAHMPPRYSQPPPHTDPQSQHHTASHTIPISYASQQFNGSTASHPQQPASLSTSAPSHAVSPSTYSSSNAIDWQWLDQIGYLHTDGDRSAAAQQQQQQQQQAAQQRPTYAMHSVASAPTPNGHIAAGYESPLVHATPARDIDPQNDRDRHHYATVIHSIHNNQQARPNGPAFSQPIPGPSYTFTPVEYGAPPPTSLALAALPLPAQPAAGTASPSPGSSKRKLARRRKLACGTCRHVKSECSGERPCRRCIRLNKADTCADPTTPYPPKKPRLVKKADTAAVSGKEKEEEEKAVVPVKEDGAEALEGSGLDEKDEAVEGAAVEDEDTDMPAKDDLLSPPSSPGSGEDDDIGHAWLSTEMYKQVVPQLAEMFKRTPATITNKSSTGLLYRLGHMFETMPPVFFKQLLEQIGYVPVVDDRADKSDKKAAVGGDKEKGRKENGHAAAEAGKDGDDRAKAETDEHSSADTEMPPATASTSSSSAASIASTASSSSTSSDMHVAVTAEDANAAHILATSASPAASTSTLSPDSTSDPPSPQTVRRTLYRSPHAHLPLISLPHRFRFNWKLSPERPFPEQDWVTNFPTVMWYHCPAAAQWVYSDNGLIVPVPTDSVVHPIPFSPDTPLRPMTSEQTALLPHEIDLSLTDQPCVLFCNTAAERLFGYTARELKLAFIREGKRAFLRLFDSSIHAAHDADMRKFNGQGQTEFYHWVRVKTKYGSVVRVLMNRKFVVDEDGFVIVNRYTFISLPKQAVEEAAKQ